MTIAIVIAVPGKSLEPAVTVSDRLLDFKSS